MSKTLRLLLSHSPYVLTALATGFALSVTAQQSAVRFEVASVKPAKPLTTAMIRSGTGHVISNDAVFDVSGMSLMNLIAMAYQTQPDLVSGPGWLQNESFAIAAKLPDGASRKDLPAMLRQLLAERFKLAAHVNQQTQPVFFLKLATGGPRFSAAPADADRAARGCQGRPGHTVCRSVSMVDLANTLTTRAKMNAQTGLARDDAARDIDLPVIDQTELGGVFDVDLEWIVGSVDGGGRGGAIAAPRDSTSATSIKEALTAVGLRLEPGKHPFDFLVIDHVERPTAN